MAINYAITADNREVMKSLRDITAKIEDLSRKMSAGGKSADKYFNEIEKGAQGASGSIKELIAQTAAFAGISLGAAGVAQFAKSVVEVRKQMQSLQVSFETLLGNKDKASAMFAELRQFAATTPLMLKDLAAGAQTMLGFNIEAEKVVPTLKAIGDISMGDSQRFQSLTLAFSQMSATGKLMGQDLLQMINAGFNPLTVIAEKTGKSISTLKDEMSKGAISSEMVADAFMAATREGGKFNGMLEKQGKTLAGQMNQLQGAIDDMFNSIGEQTEGVIKGAVSSAQALVENYEKVGKVLVSLITTYGAYRAALMAVSVIESTQKVGLGMTALSIKEYIKATKAATIAQKAFNTVAKGNPYVLLATVLVGVVSTVWALSDSLTAAEKAQRALNGAQKEFEDKQDKRIASAKELIGIIKDETSTEASRILAYRQLSELVPGLTAQYDVEAIKVAQLNDLYKQLNETQEQDRSQYLEKQIKDLDRYIAALSKAGNDWLKLEAGTASELGGLGLYGGAKTPALMADELRKQRHAMRRELKQLKDAREVADTENEKPAVQNKAYWEDQKKKAEAELEAMTDVEAKSAQGDQIKKRIEEYNKRLSAFELSKQAKTSGNEKREARDRELQAAQYRIDAMREGSAKVIAQAKLDYEKEQEEIQRIREDLAKKGAVSASDNEYLLQRDATATMQYEKTMQEAAQAESKAMDEYLAQYGELQERKAAIQRQYQEKMAKAQTDGERKILEKEMQESVDAAEKDAVGKALADISKDPALFAAMTDIDAVATQTIQRLVTKLNEAKLSLGDLDPENLKEMADIMRQMEDALFDRETDPIQQYIKATKELATAQDKVTAANAKVTKAQQTYDRAVATGGKNSQSAKRALSDLNAALAKQDDALNDEQKAQNKVLKSSAKLRVQISELADAIKGVGDAIGGEAGQILNFIGDITSFVSNSIDSVKRMAAVGAQALSTIEKASVILAIIQAAIQIFQKLNEVMNKFSSSAAYDKAVEKQKAINKLKDSVEAYRLEVLKATNAEAQWFGSDNLSKLRTNNQEMVATLDSYYSKLYETQVKYRNKSKNDNNWTNWLGALAPGAGLVGAAQWVSSVGGLIDGFKKGDNGLVSAMDNLRIETKKRKKSVFGFGGRDQQTADLRDWVEEVYGDSLFDSQNFINKELATQVIEDYGGKLQGDTKATLESLIALKEQYDEYQGQLKEYVSELYAPLVENMTDAIMTWLDTGKDALKSFKEAASETFKDIVKDMVQTLVFDKVIGSFQDDVAKLYEEYSTGTISEAEMSKSIALLTAELADRYETEIPVLQGIATDISTTLKDVAGIDITKKDQETATQGLAASFSQDSIDQANGRLAALQMGQQQQVTSTIGISQTMERLAADSGNQATHLSTLVDLAGMRNAYIEDIYTRLGQMQGTIDARLGQIATNTQNL